MQAFDLTFNCSTSPLPTSSVEFRCYCFPGMTFNSGETERSITFTAAQDAVNDDGEAVRLTFGTLPDAVMPGSTIDVATVRIDDDVPSLPVSFEQATYSVEEGSATTIKVILSADPERALTIPIVRTNQGGATSADYSGVPLSVTFNAGATEQDFTFTAIHDAADDDGESIRLSFGSILPAGVTEATPTEATVNIVDDGTAGVTVDPTTLSIPEHATSSYTVVLDSQPTHDVTVTINSPAGTEIVKVQPRLTFTTVNWHQEQTVTVIANPDRDTADDTGTISHTVDSLDADYDGVTPKRCSRNGNR